MDSVIIKGRFPKQFLPIKCKTNNQEKARFQFKFDTELGSNEIVIDTDAMIFEFEGYFMLTEEDRKSEQDLLLTNIGRYNCLMSMPEMLDREIKKPPPPKSYKKYIIQGKMKKYDGIFRLDSEERPEFWAEIYMHQKIIKPQ